MSVSGVFYLRTALFSGCELPERITGERAKCHEGFEREALGPGGGVWGEGKAFFPDNLRSIGVQIFGFWCILSRISML